MKENIRWHYEPLDDEKLKSLDEKEFSILVKLLIRLYRTTENDTIKRIAKSLLMMLVL